MHDIVPFDRWLKYYEAANDPKNPYEIDSQDFDDMVYSETIYGYYIDPRWDSIGSDTLYAKILFVDYEAGEVIIEMFGEWNDALHNDVMFLKRNIIDHFLYLGIAKFVLITEQVFNYHGADDDYYAEWFEELEEGYIVAIGAREHVAVEWSQFGLDTYIIYGDFIDVPQWRTLHPKQLLLQVQAGVDHLLS